MLEVLKYERHCGYLVHLFRKVLHDECEVLLTEEMFMNSVLFGPEMHWMRISPTKSLKYYNLI